MRPVLWFSDAMGSGSMAKGGPGAPIGARCIVWLLVLCVHGLWLAPAMAEAGRRDGAEWVKHRILRGERLSEIAERHGVRVSSIVRWNKLDKKRPRIRAGKHLRIRSRLSPPPRKKVLHRVRRGDSWSRIARRYGVNRKHLQRRWNRKVGTLRAGARVVVWVDGTPAGPPEAGPPPPTTELPVVAVPTTSFSVGRADRGRLVGGLRLPDNPALYTVRNPQHSYGSSHTLMQLQLAVAKWRGRSGFGGPLLINDMSRRRGGRFRPHRSHRSGRDADIQLPAVPDVPDGRPPINIGDVDWNAAWSLLSAVLETGEVKYIFLSRSRQRALHRAALRAGKSEEELTKVMEYPRHGGPVPIRHARGHNKHFHVRFKCAEWEKRCRD